MDGKQIAIALIIGFTLFYLVKYEAEPWFYEELCEHDVFKSCTSNEQERLGD